MKNLVALFVLVLVASPLFAQSNKEDIDIIQSVLGKEKKAIVASFIQVQGPQGDAFWKLYDEYEVSRKELGKKRIALLERYAANYQTLDDATTDSIIKDLQSLQGQTDKLIIQYYGKIKKASGVKPAAQFYQLEGYLLTVIRGAILDSIPFIGELDQRK